MRLRARTEGSVSPLAGTGPALQCLSVDRPDMGWKLGAPIRGGVDCKPGASRAWPWTSLNWAPLSGVAVDCELGAPLGVAVDFTELGAPLGRGRGLH
ncbi:MAG: hypothetical protein AMXMBFR33_47060 [Candidatus Xenobia bacterium]